MIEITSFQHLREIAENYKLQTLDDDSFIQETFIDVSNGDISEHINDFFFTDSPENIEEMGLHVNILNEAIWCNCPNLVKFVISLGSDPNKPYNLDGDFCLESIYSIHPETAKVLIPYIRNINRLIENENGEKKSVLHNFLIFTNQKEKIKRLKLLIDMGFDRNLTCQPKHETPLLKYIIVQSTWFFPDDFETMYGVIDILTTKENYNKPSVNLIIPIQAVFSLRITTTQKALLISLIGRY